MSYKRKDKLSPDLDKLIMAFPHCLNDGNEQLPY